MKRKASYFTSYAHADSADVARFRAVMEPVLKASAHFEFGGWTDHQILPGERWRTEIDAALETAAFGLLLVSPAFLGSEFITRNELPVLLDKPMVVPVALQKIAMDGSFDLKGLEDRQIFYDSRQRAFDGCGRMTGRREFANELFSKIVRLLNKHLV